MDFYHSTQNYTLKSHILHSQHHEDIKSNTFMICLTTTSVPSPPILIFTGQFGILSSGKAAGT
jgi:hypothetical protein